MKRRILVWAGWYPEEEQSLDGLFIKKHIDLIGEDNIVHAFTISHKRKKVNWYESEFRQEHFGSIMIYHVPNFIILKFLGYMLIPLIEGLRIKDKIDVFHLHSAVPFSLFTYGLELLFIKKWVLTEHWSGFTTYSGKFDKLSFIQKFILRSRIKRFDGVSMVSQGLLNEMEKRNLLPEKKYIIPNRLKFRKTGEFAERSAFSFCTVSRLDNRHKNISGLIEAVEIAVKMAPDLRLYIYGDGPDNELLQKKAREAGLLNRSVFFEGVVKNELIEEVYIRHSAFVMMSNFETYSIATAEALTHGLPVIATACGGPEFFTNKTNGIVLKVGDIQGCADAMLQLMERQHEYNPDEIINGMKVRFSDNAIKDGFEKLYTLS